MFRDKNEELKRLEDALLEQETEQVPRTEEEEEEIPDFTAYNTDFTDTDLEEFSEAVLYPPEKKSPLGFFAGFLIFLTVLFCCLVAYIFLKGGFFS